MQGESAQSKKTGGGKGRLRLALQWLRCCLAHEILTDAGWTRCNTCHPIKRRTRRTKEEADLLFGISEYLKEGALE